jgi:dTMP kinase
MLVEFLEKSNRPARLVHFPNFASPTGRRIAGHLRGEGKATPRQMAALYADNKYEAAGQIRGLLSSGFNVVVDRYTASNCAYQSARIPGPREKKDAFALWVLRLEALLPRPDATLIIDASPAVAFRKNLEKKGRAYLQSKRDVYERDLAFQRQVRAQYLSCAKLARGQRTLVINAMAGKRMASKEAVASRVLSALSKARLLPSRRKAKGK